MMEPLRVAQPNDANRKIMVTVLAFDVPKGVAV